MSSEVILILVLLTLCLILGISLIVVLQDIFKLEKKLQKSDEENKTFRNSLQQQADIVQDDAHKKAMQLLEEANRKAVGIVSSSESLNDAAKTQLQNSLKSLTQSESQELSKISTDLEKEYQEAIKHVQVDSNEIVKKITEEIEKQAGAELASFTEALRKELITSQKNMQQQIEANYQTVQKEVESYKQAQMTQVQQHIFELIRFLTESALGKGISLNEHQDLVLSALQEAKAQGVIR